VRVLYEDNHLLAVSKPAGLLAQGGVEGAGHLVLLLDAYRREAESKAGRAYVGLVHRLDRNVSGAMVVAKTSKAAARLSEAFRTREEARLVKTYLAWVQGTPDPPEGTWIDRLHREGKVTRRAPPDDPEAKVARLDYATQARSRRAARLSIDLGTGRTHQIRVQCSLAGHPILGDVKYGGPPGDRPALHAWRLVVPHPVRREETIEIVAPVPDDLRRLDQWLAMAPPLGP